MKSKKILVLLLTFAMLFTQFEMLVTVSATDSSGEFKVGVAAHPYTDEYRNNLEDIVYYAAEMGSKVIRIDLLKYIGCKWWDKFFALCDAYGIDLIGIVYNVEDAEFFAERYTDQISYMQLENERDVVSILGNTYDGTNAEHYDQSKIAENAELLISLNNAVKEVAPNMPTMINITWIHYGFIEAVMDVGLKVDAIGLDWYSDMEGVQNQSLGNTLDNLKTKFDLPIWITEANVRQDATGSGDSQMAETINAFIDACLEKQTADNVLGLCVYELFNEPTQAGSPGEAHYGLVNVNNEKTVGEPKQAYYDVEKHLEELGLKEVGDVTRITYSSALKKYAPLVTQILDFEDGESYTYGNWWSDGKVVTDIVSSGKKSFYKYWSNRFPSHNFVFFQPVDGSYFDLSDADTLSIDLYIDNINNWNLVYKERAGIEFQANRTNTEYKYINIPQGLKQGWNTIEIKLSDIGLELSKITGIRVTPMLCNNWGSDGVPPLSMLSGTYDESVANVSLRIDNIRKIIGDSITPIDTAKDYAYTFAVVPDTQVILREDLRTNTTNFDKLYDYIANNIETQKIKAVIGLGDITDNNTDAEWLKAKENIQKLDGKVPYILARGNNDSYAKLDEYFGNTHYSEQLSGTYNGSITNSYIKLNIGEVKYIIFALEFCASDDILNWAGNIADANADYNVIITTHNYLLADGGLNPDTTTDPLTNGGENNADQIWEKFVSKHENISLVLCGHTDSDLIVRRTDEGNEGNKVVSMLMNMQGRETDIMGMVGLLHFSEDGKIVQVEYYSTTRNGYYVSQNQFTFSIDTVGNDSVVIDESEEFTLGENGETSVTVSSADVSTSRMFEMLVTVPASVTELIVKLTDNDGGYRTYNFKDLKEGKNYLVVRKNDYTKDCDLELSEVTGYIVVGIAGANISVADFIASDYIDYDVNNDTEINILDLVRAKKLSVSATTDGNAVAIPEGGYSINSRALTLLRRYLLLPFSGN